MVKRIVISWLIVLLIIFFIFHFSFIKNGFVLLLLLLFLPLIPFLIIFLNKKTTVKRVYYKYGLALPAVLYYIAYFIFIWIVINAFKHFTGIG